MAKSFKLVLRCITIAAIPQIYLTDIVKKVSFVLSIFCGNWVMV